MTASEQKKEKKIQVYQQVNTNIATISFRPVSGRCSLASGFAIISASISIVLIFVSIDAGNQSDTQQVKADRTNRRASERV